MQGLLTNTDKYCFQSTMCLQQQLMNLLNL